MAAKSNKKKKINKKAIIQKYDKRIELQRYEKLVKPNLIDIQALFHNGLYTQDIEPILGLNEHELYYMTYVLFLPELTSIFIDRNHVINIAERDLTKTLHGYSYYEEVVNMSKKVYYDKNNKKVEETVPIVTRIKKYVQPDIKAIMFYLTNMKPEDFKVKGQEVIDNENQDRLEQLLREMYNECPSKENDNDKN